MLCNTSFNTRGKPILNRLSEAMQMLFELPDLDYVLINDILFSKHGATKTRSLWEKKATERQESLKKSLSRSDVSTAKEIITDQDRQSVSTRKNFHLDL